MTTIDEIRKRLEAATKGLWKVDGRLVFADGETIVARCSEPHGGRYATPQHWTQEANAALIANAPTDIAYLLKLAEYAQHGVDCSINPVMPCDCGLDDLLKESAQTTPRRR